VPVIVRVSRKLQEMSVVDLVDYLEVHVRHLARAAEKIQLAIMNLQILPGYVVQCKHVLKHKKA